MFLIIFLFFCGFLYRKQKTGSAPRAPQRGDHGVSRITGASRLTHHGRHGVSRNTGAMTSHERYDVSRASRRLTEITAFVLHIFVFFMFLCPQKTKNGQRSRGPPGGGTMTYPRP